MDTHQIDKIDAWPRVQEALADPRWDFRTVEGISRETGLNRSDIVELLEEHRPEVRRTVSRDRNGRALYTTKSWPVGPREVIADLQAFAAKTF